MNLLKARSSNSYPYYKATLLGDDISTIRTVTVAAQVRWPGWPRNSIQIRVSKIPHPSERNCKLVNVIVRFSEKEKAKFLLKNR